MTRNIAAADAEEFRNQYPAYHVDIVSETFQGARCLRTDPVHRERYDRFLADMVYGGERWEFDEAIKTLADVAVSVWQA